MTWTCEPGAGMGGAGGLGAGAASQDCPLSTWGAHCGELTEAVAVRGRACEQPGLPR